MEAYRIHKKAGSLEVDVQGDREFVLEQFERLWNEDQVMPRERNAKHAIDPEESMSEYVARLSPSSHTDTVLAIGGYLLQNRGVREFGKRDIEDGFREILRPLPGNTSQAIANLVKQGYAMKAGKREGSLTYSVTQSGLERLAEGFGSSGNHGG